MTQGARRELGSAMEYPERPCKTLKVELYRMNRKGGSWCAEQRRLCHHGFPGSRPCVCLRFCQLRPLVTEGESLLSCCCSFGTSRGLAREKGASGWVMYMHFWPGRPWFGKGSTIDKLWKGPGTEEGLSTRDRAALLFLNTPRLSA